jgi:magnesium-protoporphyrin O-methyltransferase
MTSAAYDRKRGELAAYFDRTAADAWARLTSDAPVSRIRATVRAGRDTMRQTLLSWLPADLSGARLLDAGCGTGALAVAAARRGADVAAVDLAPTLLTLAGERLPQDLAAGQGTGRVAFHAGDMLDPVHGVFDHVVAMDSVIYHRSDELVRIVEALAERTRRSILITFAPRTPLLAAMHAAGKLFPRADRSPAIVPVAERELLARLDSAARLTGWRVARMRRVAKGFYISQALELRRS